MRTFKVTLWPGKKAEKKITVKGDNLASAMCSAGHGGIMLCEFEYTEEMTPFEKAIKNAAYEQIILEVNGERSTLKEFLHTNLEEPGVHHITQAQANEVINLQPNQFTMIGISQVRRVDGLEVCWECTGSGVMAGNFPCKVCQATGYIPKQYESIKK